MAIPEDLTTIARQEDELVLPAFDSDTAWSLGTTLRELAIARGQSIVVDIRRFGQPHQQLFYAALDGTTPDNQRWVQRKINVVARFHHSSYAIGLKLQQSGLTFAERYSLPDADYAAHGGCFPLRVAHAGIVGCVTVSGLPQREDHNLVVEGLCLLLQRDHDSLRLPALS
ncbi:MAG: heme-degrading domain-containing protein [Edaphobacter sp.]